MTASADDLSYPIGRFSARPPAAELRRRSVADIGALPEHLAAAVLGLNEAQLDTPYRPGGWTVRQVVHHVADSHINAYTRFRLGFTEDTPTIRPYEEKAWAELPDVRHLGIEVSLRLLEPLHERLVHLLQSAPPASFARQVVHPENGAMTLDSLLGIYAWHGRHHTA